MARVVLGVSGGIAAYKACELLRRLRESGHAVRVIPTANALQFVGAATWEALSGQPVTNDVFDDVDQVAHVRVGQEADFVVVAPATANVLAKVCSRLGRRLADQRPPDGPMPGDVRAGDAYRNVGAPGYPGQRGRTPKPRRAGRRAGRRATDGSGLPARAVCLSPSERCHALRASARSWRGRDGPGGSSRGHFRGRHAGGHRSSALHRQSFQRQARVRSGDGGRGKGGTGRRRRGERRGTTTRWCHRSPGGVDSRTGCGDA